MSAREALRSVLIELLHSKKFWVSMVGVVAQLVMLFGWELDQDVALQVVSPLYLYVASQGVADMNKERR